MKIYCQCSGKWYKPLYLKKYILEYGAFEVVISEENIIILRKYDIHVLYKL